MENHTHIKNPFVVHKKIMKPLTSGIGIESNKSGP
jgi:hypothetical protein